MRAVIQRVSQSSVMVGDRYTASIQKGMLVLLGIEDSDDIQDVDWLAGKVAKLRIFNDDEGVMNLSVKDVNGGVIVVSQFTLHASTKKGNRPSYVRAAHPDVAIPLYEGFVKTLGDLLGIEVATGEFGAMMQVSLVNDGPVSILIDTKNKE